MTGRDDPARIFFAYPSKPEARRETIAAAADAISLSDAVVGVTWEDLGTPGRLAIDEILRAIEASAVLICDITN